MRRPHGQRSGSGLRACPRAESPEEAVELLLERGYSACEIDFEGGFWMDYPWAERFGELARDAKIVLSVHAPLAGFMGHVERDKKHRMAIGMLDHSAGVAVAAGAEARRPPPRLPARPRRARRRWPTVVEQLAELRERLEGKGRGVPFGVEVMGRVRELGTAEDVFAIAAQLPWVRPVIDFAHLHAVTDGAFTDAEPSPACSRPRTRCWSRARRSTSTSATSRTRTGTRRSTCPTARARCARSRWRRRCAKFKRPATVISESPDEASSSGDSLDPVWRRRRPSAARRRELRARRSA